MSKTDLFNGFGNRFLWGCVERAQLLPLGGDVPTEELKKLTERMKSAVEFSKRMSEVEFSSKATELWARGYQQLSADVPGALGAVTSRAEAQVRRLAIIYALMHESKRVLLQHLRAALEIWRFCRDSAEFIFVDSAGPSMEEKLMEIIPTTGLGIARTGISRVFSNHQSKEIATALKNMETLGLAKPTIVVTGGRPGE